MTWVFKCTDIWGVNLTRHFHCTYIWCEIAVIYNLITIKMWQTVSAIYYQRKLVDLKGVNHSEDVCLSANAAYFCFVPPSVAKIHVSSAIPTLWGRKDVIELVLLHEDIWVLQNTSYYLVFFHSLSFSFLLLLLC